MLDSLDPHLGDGGSRQVAKQDTAQGITQRRAETFFNRFGDKPSVVLPFVDALYIGDS